MNGTRWCYTWNNPDGIPALGTTKYHVYGKEMGASGTPHYQGFVIFPKNHRLAALKKMIPAAHWEVAKGSNVQAAAYCKKDGDFVEDGEVPLPKGEGEKLRWSQALSAAKEGRLDEIPADIMLRYRSNILSIQKDYMVMPADLPGDKVEHLWYYGEPGTGKSRKAREENPGAYMKMCNKWWDGYRGEEVVIIEDLDRKHDVLGHHLKIWADRYSFLAEIKNGARAIRPRLIIVTSNYSIDEIWNDEQTMLALQRRFKQIHFSKIK